jgi:hypothetical protein
MRVETRELPNGGDAGMEYYVVVARDSGGEIVENYFDDCERAWFFVARIANKCHMYEATCNH